MINRKHVPWLFLGAVALPAFAAGIEYISKQQYGEEWPFTVADGRISCLPEPNWRGNSISEYGAVLFHADKNTYMLNGTAMTANKKFGYGWKPVDEIWRINEKLKKQLGSNAAFIPRISLDPIISKGLKLCK